MLRIKKNLKAQVWVETVVYTLIGLTIIAILLTMAVPQIDKIKDKAIIEQTIAALNSLDNKISYVQQAPGNSRAVDLKISKGKLEIDSQTDLIRYTLDDTKLELSEPGKEIRQGNVILLTNKTAARFMISLTMNYDNLNLSNEDGEVIKTLHAGPTPYKISIENKETSDVGQITTIEFEVV
tara:strand:- start:1779 stop:2321 length:543 start_codon:yes stop_codon:yes gene_type:complete